MSMASTRTFVGLVVSPVNGEVLAVWQLKDNFMGLVTLFGEKRGTGSFDEGRDSFRKSAEITGFPRVHTAGGVVDHGTGLGTALYTGLCLAATMTSRGAISIPIRQHAEGISSLENIFDENGEEIDHQRSDEADEWWKNARDKFGLVHDVTTEEEFEQEYDHRLVDSGEYSGAPDWLDVDRWARDQDIYGSVRVKSWSARADIAVERMVSTTLTAQVYPYEAAERDHLVIAEIQSDDARVPLSSGGNWLASQPALLDVRKRALMGAIGAVDVQALALCNTGLFRGMGEDGKIALDLLVEIAKKSGMPREDIERMQLRYMLGFDARYRYASSRRTKAFDPVAGYGDGVPYESMVRAAVMGDEDATPNRRRRGRRGRYNMSPAPAPEGIEISFYSEMIPNQADPRVVKEAEKLAEGRAELGWAKYAAAADEG